MGAFQHHTLPQKNRQIRVRIKNTFPKDSPFSPHTNLIEFETDVEKKITANKNATTESRNNRQENKKAATDLVRSEEMVKKHMDRRIDLMIPCTGISPFLVVEKYFESWLLEMERKGVLEKRQRCYWSGRWKWKGGRASNTI